MIEEKYEYKNERDRYAGIELQDLILNLLKVRPIRNSTKEN